MSNQNAEAFLDRLSSEPTFQQSFETFSQSDEALDAFAKEHGYEFSKEEFQQVFEKKFGRAFNVDGSLTEEALEGVSGGFVGPLIRSAIKWGIGLLTTSTIIKTGEKLTD